MADYYAELKRYLEYCNNAVDRADFGEIPEEEKTAMLHKLVKAYNYLSKHLMKYPKENDSNHLVD